MMQENNPSYPLIAELLKKYGGEKIVDNGCGRNEFKRTYNQRIIGLDLKYEEADLITDGKKLPFMDNSVDTFTSNFVLEHVDDQMLYLQEMKRVMKKDGTVILSIPKPVWYLSYFLSPSAWLRPIREWKAFKKGPFKFYAHGKPHQNTVFKEIKDWREKNYLRMFKEAGLEIKERHISCNIFSLNKRCAKVLGKYKLPEWLNVHVTYVLQLDSYSL